MGLLPGLRVESIESAKLGANPNRPRAIHFDCQSLVCAQAVGIVRIILIVSELTGFIVESAQAVCLCTDPQVPPLILGDGPDCIAAEVVGILGVVSEVGPLLAFGIKTLSP
jgi:hypothetical protein